MRSRRIVLSLVAVVALVLSSANVAEACHRGGCGGCFGGMFGGLFHRHHCCCMSDCGCSSCDDGCGCGSDDGGCGCGESAEPAAQPASPEAAAPDQST